MVTTVLAALCFVLGGPDAPPSSGDGSADPAVAAAQAAQAVPAVLLAVKPAGDQVQAIAIGCRNEKGNWLQGLECPASMVKDAKHVRVIQTDKGAVGRFEIQRVIEPLTDNTVDPRRYLGIVVLEEGREQLESGTINIPFILAGGPDAFQRVPYKKFKDTDGNALKAVLAVLKAWKANRKCFKQVKILDGYTLDVDGDGKQENILVVSSYEGEDLANVPAPAVSAVIYYRLDESGRPVGVLVTGSKVNKPNEGLYNDYAITGLFDLDGDGRVEILVYWAYDGGSGYTVFQFVDGQATALASWGEGPE